MESCTCGLELNVRGEVFSGLAAGPEAGELVLLLHGFPQFADSWSEVMRPLAEAGLRVVAMDQRGYARGTRTTLVQDYAVSALAADVVGFAEALGVRRFHVVGHDWGGLVAWQLAAEAPERLRTVSVLSTPHTNAFQDALRSSVRQMWMSKYVLLFRMKGLAEWALLAGDARALRGAYLGKVPAAQEEANVRRLREPGALTAALNWYRALEPGLRIGRCGVPALYVWGDRDQALGEAAARGTARYCAGEYRFERLRGRSHWLLEEAAGEVAGLLLEHIGTHTGEIE